MTTVGAPMSINHLETVHGERCYFGYRRQRECVLRFSSVFPRPERVIFYYFQYNTSDFHITTRTWPLPGMLYDSAELGS